MVTYPTKTIDMSDTERKGTLSISSIPLSVRKDFYDRCKKDGISANALLRAVVEEYANKADEIDFGVILKEIKNGNR